MDEIRRSRPGDETRSAARPWFVGGCLLLSAVFACIWGYEIWRAPSDMCLLAIFLGVKSSGFFAAFAWILKDWGD